LGRMAGLSRATSVVFVALLFFHHASEGFQVPRSRSVLKRPAFTRFERSRLAASSLPISDDDVLASSIVKPGPHIKVYGRTLSLVGFYFLFVTFGSAILMYPVLTAAWLRSLCFDRTQRKAPCSPACAHHGNLPCIVCPSWRCGVCGSGACGSWA